MTRRTLDLIDKQMVLERRPDMADCPALQALDDGSSRILGFPDLNKLCEIIAAKPVVPNAARRVASLDYGPIGEE